MTCHQDQHKGRLGQNCASCHNFVDWKSINMGQFDHSKTHYPLTGLHLQVQCAKCHTNGADGKPQYVGIPFSQCSDCHKDPHHGSFPQSCQSCHNTSGWKKISLQTVNQRFDHSKTKFPLEGKHVSVDCAQCHANGDFKKPLVFAKCMDCHKDPHKGQFVKRSDQGECASCHTVQGWKPSTYSVADHARVATLVWNARSAIFRKGRTQYSRSNSIAAQIVMATGTRGSLPPRRISTLATVVIR